jgi:hypothetical protein
MHHTKIQKQGESAITAEYREVIIPKQEAVFWLDRQGYWRNQGGRFKRKKIIDYFHASIGRDKNGYFVSHVKENVLEKVYFRHEETALFVFKVDINPGITLTLNTGSQIKLNPDNLYVFNDNLYIMNEDEKIKFAERALFQIMQIISEENGVLFINANGKRYKIPEKY